MWDDCRTRGKLAVYLTWWRTMWDDASACGILSENMG